MNQLRLTLLQARKGYSRSAGCFEAEIRTHGLSDHLSEKIIGVGVAADWVRRAAEMEDIEYIGKQLNKSSRKNSFLEIQRFGFSWFGLNAIFARPSLLHVLGTPNGAGEFERFLVLFRATPLPNANSLTQELVDLLAAKISSRYPNSQSGTTNSTLSVIQNKYLSHSPPAGRTARAILDAANTGNFGALDLGTLVYAFRNWTVHGCAMDGCFGSRTRFRRYIEILQQVLADVHLTTASAIEAHI